MKDQLALLDSEKLHHAYLIEAVDKSLVGRLVTILEKRFAISSKGNPDFLVLYRDTFGIDESHELIRLQVHRVAEGLQKLIVIYTGSITKEAQNALLKVFEEPTPSTHFFLVVPSLGSILPTLKSRLMILGNSDFSESVDAREFLAFSVSERFSWFEKLVEHPEDEAERSEKQTAILALMNGIEVEVSKLDFRDRKEEVIAAVLQARKYLHDSSMSAKLILGALATSLPQM